MPGTFLEVSSWVLPLFLHLRTPLSWARAKPTSPPATLASLRDVLPAFSNQNFFRVAWCCTETFSSRGICMLWLKFCKRGCILCPRQTPVVCHLLVLVPASG